MSKVVLVLTRVGFYGMEDERTRSQAWAFDTPFPDAFESATTKLKALYREEIARSTSSTSKKLVPGILYSFYDTEHWQFKIVGDDAMTIGFIMTEQDTGDDDLPNMFGVNQGPNMEA